jgi:hypothetical protein
MTFLYTRNISTSNKILKFDSSVIVKTPRTYRSVCSVKGMYTIWVLMWAVFFMTLRDNYRGTETRWGVWCCVPVQTGLAAHSVSCVMGIGSFQGVERLGRADDFPSLSSAEVAKGLTLYLLFHSVPLHECYNIWALFVVRSTLMAGLAWYVFERMWIPIWKRTH